MGTKKETPESKAGQGGARPGVGPASGARAAGDGPAGEAGVGPEPAPPEDTARIALTGASSFLGGLVLKRLSEMPSVREIHVIDIRMPEVPSNKIVFHRIDLTRDTADSEIAALLKGAGVRTFLHGALFSGPQRERGRAREVESIGTFHVLNALAEAGTARLVVFSDTFTYGALPGNPNFIGEGAPLRGVGPQFVRTRVDVEKQVLEFAADYPGCAVCTLRFAPILGPTSDNVRARYFAVGLVPKVMGYDPLLQFIHEDDALRAAMLATSTRARGVFNIVGKGVIPLSTGIHMAGKMPLPVAGFVCRTVFSIGYGLRVWDLPPGLVPFYQYLCVADGRKAERVLGFKPQYSSRQALKSMVEAQRLRAVGFAVPSVRLGEEGQAGAAAMGFERVL